jgi:hypothetical protein
MKSTLKIGALALFALSLLPDMALAGKKRTKYSPPETSMWFQNMMAGNRPSRPKRYAAVRSGRDCGEADAQEANGINMISQAASFIPVPMAGQIASMILGGISSDASMRSENKRWGCVQRNLNSQIAGIGKQMDQRLDQQDAKLNNTFDGVVAAHRRIDELEEEVQRLRLLTSESKPGEIEVPPGVTIQPQPQPPAPSAAAPDAPVSQAPPASGDEDDLAKKSGGWFKVELAAPKAEPVVPPVKREPPVPPRMINAQAEPSSEDKK